MRALLVVMVGLLATPVAAEPPARRAPVAAPTAPTAVDTTPPEAAASACPPAVAGRARHRRRVCRIETDIVISTAAPRPGVLIVDPGARVVVGRPRRANRLADLPRHLP